jgi:hypothetical protein
MNNNVNISINVHVGNDTVIKSKLLDTGTAVIDFDDVYLYFSDIKKVNQAITALRKARKDLEQVTSGQK